MLVIEILYVEAALAANFPSQLVTFLAFKFQAKKTTRLRSLQVPIFGIGWAVTLETTKKWRMMMNSEKAVIDN